MEQKKEPRNQSMNIWSTDLQQGCQEYTMRKGQSLQQMVLGKLYVHTQKNKIRPLFYTIHKNQLKKSKRFKCKFATVKFLDENIGKNFIILGLELIS